MKAVSAKVVSCCLYDISKIPIMHGNIPHTHPHTHTPTHTPSAVVVVQLVKRSLPTPEIRGSKPSAILFAINCIKNCVGKTKVSKKRPGVAIFLSDSSSSSSSKELHDPCDQMFKLKAAKIYPKVDTKSSHNSAYFIVTSF